MRSSRIRNIISGGGVRPITDISEYFSESSCIRRGHFFGYSGNLGELSNTTILIGICCEKEGPSIALYPSLEAAKSISRHKGCRVRAIVPAYEFNALGIYSDAEAEKICSATRRVLKPYGFEIIDTLHDEPYMTKRLDLAFRIQRFIGKEFRDPVGDDSVGLQITSAEIADILLCMRGSDTLLIADQGSAIPALRASKIARKQKINSKLSCMFYVEPRDISGNDLMYYGKDKMKIYLRPGDENNLLAAKTTGGASLEHFRQNGGIYKDCIVGETESMICESDADVNESCRRCTEGTFERGCSEHKEHVVEILARLIEDLA